MKLYLVINEKGDIQGVKFTTGSVDDRVAVPDITKHLTGYCLVIKAI